MRLSFTLLIICILFVSGVSAQSLSVTVSNQANVAVNGQSTGSVTLAGTGGTAPYQFSKDGISFQSSPTFNALAAGSYTFTIRDAALATATVNATVTQASTLVLSLVSQTNVSVIGQSTGSVTLAAAGGTSPYQYSKNGTTFQSSGAFGGLAAGNYTFTVRDASLNSTSIGVTITQSNVLTIYLNSQTNVAVIGQNTGSVTLSGAGGTPPYQFSKNGITYQSSGTFNSLVAGPYTFTVRDAVFNASSINVIISQPAPLALVIASKTDVKINGQKSGSVTLSGNGGTPPYQYSKDGTTFQSSPTFNSLGAGSYTFTLRDAASGSVTATASITEPPVLELSLASKTDIDAYGNNTGSVNLIAAGGVAPYQYSKDGATFGDSNTFSSLEAGAYTFTLRDAAGAMKILNVALIQPAFAASALKVMNNFSPNGDGVNDTWQVENVEDLPEHTLTIFDRGGRVLLKARNYKNDWNGTVNGSSLAEGTYYYALSFDAPVSAVRKGFITLVK